MGILRQSKLALMDRNIQARFLFQDGFRILDAYCAPSIGPDVNHPHFIYFFLNFCLIFAKFFFDSELIAAP